MINDLTVSTEIKEFNLPLVLNLLSQTHWASKRSSDQILKSFENSLCFGIFNSKKEQIGFGRVITDYATTAYLCDMVVLPELRGQGVGSKLLESIFSYHSIKDLKWILRTRDAASLYKKFGFNEAILPGRFMEKFPT